MTFHDSVILSEARDRQTSRPILRSLRSLRMTLFLLLCASAPLSAQSADFPLAARSKGSPTAPVTVYEMSDFQCPYCKRFTEETFPRLEQSYITAGKVRWVFVNFPLTSLHDHAAAAGEVALCAGKQKAFWRVHDLLFKYQETWAPLKEPAPFFLSLADSAGLSKKALLACLQAPNAGQALKAEAEGSQRSGATSTPTFYIEGGLMEGAVPFDVFRRVLDSVFAEKSGRAVRR